MTDVYEERARRDDTEDIDKRGGCQKKKITLLINKIRCNYLICFSLSCRKLTKAKITHPQT